LTFNFLIFITTNLLLIDLEEGTTDSTSTASSNETDLLARGSIAADSRGVTNVLVITTTVGMLDGIHSNTTNLGPRVALDAVLVVTAACLEHGLFGTTTTSNLADHGTAVAADNLLLARGELDTGDVGIGVVCNDDGIVTRAAGHGTTVTSALLDVADDGTFRHGANGLDITDVEASTLSAVEVLSRVDTLGSNEELLLLLEANGVSEFNLGQGGTTARIVQELSDYTADITVALILIQNTELGGSLSVGIVGFEDGPTTLTLRANDATHLQNNDIE